MGVDPEALLIGEAYRVRGEGIELVKRVELDVRRFLRAAEGSGVVERLSRVAAAPLERGLGAAFLDPTGRLFGVVSVEPLSGPGSSVWVVRTEPPFVPHHLLAVAYLYRLSGLVPTGLLRTEPVYSLVTPMVRGGPLAAAAAQVLLGLLALDRYAVGEVSALPLLPELLELPVESDRLYLTPLGLSTAPLDLGFCVEVETGALPEPPPQLLSRLASLREVLEGVARAVVG